MKYLKTYRTWHETKQKRVSISIYIYVGCTLLFELRMHIEFIFVLFLVWLLEYVQSAAVGDAAAICLKFENVKLFALARSTI